MAYTIIANIGVCDLNDDFEFVQDNPCNLMTLDNEIMLCDDIYYPYAYVAGTTIFTVSDAIMYPDFQMKIPIVIHTFYGDFSDILVLDTDGTAHVDNSFYQPMFLLNGIKWHINANFYTPAIGNIYNDGTSDLTAI